MLGVMVPEDLTGEMMPTAALVPYAGNAKRHPDWQVEQIANSIQAFGFNDPIAIWHDVAGHPVVVEGHGRLLAAKRLGMDEVPVIALDHLDEEGRRAYTLAHNRLTMNTDYDALLLDSELGAIEGFDMAEFGFEVSDIGDFGTDFKLPEGDAPHFKTITLQCTEEQAALIMDALSGIDRDSCEMHGGNEHGDKVAEVVRQWAGR